MKKTNDSFEAVKHEMQQRLGDTTPLTDALEENQEIPLETLASMGDTLSHEEFVAQLQKHGLQVEDDPEAPKPQKTEPTRQELEDLKLNPAVEDTPENYERYWKNRKMAQDKMGQSMFVQSYLEQPEQQPGAPVNEQALDDLNAASYQGNYAELRELSKKLKKEEEET